MKAGQAARHAAFAIHNPDVVGVCKGDMFGTYGGSAQESGAVRVSGA